MEHTHQTQTTNSEDLVMTEQIITTSSTHPQSTTICQEEMKFDAPRAPMGLKRLGDESLLKELLEDP